MTVLDSYERHRWSSRADLVSPVYGKDFGVSFATEMFFMPAVLAASVQERNEFWQQAVT